MIKILIFTHGGLGSEMLKTAQSIVGEQENIFVFSLSLKDSLVSVSEGLKKLLDSIKDEDGILVLTDMLGGTPCNASLPLCKDYKIEIITGVNLYMLISALMSRSNISLKELAEKVQDDAKKNITNARETFMNRMK